MRLKTAGLTAAVMAGLAAAPVASAEVLGTKGGFTYVKKEKTLPGSSGVQTADATAKCPNSTEHTGGGGTVTGRPTGTTLASSGTATDRQWYVEGWHTGINPTNRKLTAWVICSKKTGKFSMNSQPQSVDAGPTTASATAECTGGAAAVGGGVRLIGPAQDWSLNSTSPVDVGSPDPFMDNGWRSFAYHRSGPPASMIADVICMDGPVPAYSETSRTTSAKKVTIKSTCDGGRSVIGGGAFASGPSQDAHITSTNPIDTNADKDKVPDDGWKSKFYNDNGTSQTFRSYQVCD